jgi:opacity protein-like surface antigen
MVKGLAVSAVLLLLLSSAAVADIDQDQGFVVGNDNLIFTAGPDSAAQNTNALTVAQDQMATDRVGHVTAYQGEVGSLIQSAGAMAICGELGFLQEGTAFGAQAQNQNGSCFDLGIQSQNLGADLDQHVVGNGLGSALGIQGFTGFQTQLTFTMFGANANTQAVGVTLFDAVGGTGPTMAIINESANVGVGQTQ